MKFTPRPARPDEATGLHRAYAQYRWGDKADGQWWLMLDVPQSTDRGEAQREASRIRVAARRWGQRNGLVAESRRRNSGRQVWIRFVSREEMTE
jgi:hypothetical protein